jgi:hypothetical protein
MALTSARQHVEIRIDPVDPQRLQWYEARHLLIDHGNGQRKDLREVARLAALCEHPEAKWLTDVFTRNGGVPTSRRKAKALFLKDGGDARALAMAGLVVLPYDWDLISSLLRRALRLLRRGRATLRTATRSFLGLNALPFRTSQRGLRIWVGATSERR